MSLISSLVQVVKDNKWLNGWIKCNFSDSKELSASQLRLEALCYNSYNVKLSYNLLERSWRLRVAIQIL